MGAWVTYGLGTANKNLPTFVILTDAEEVLGGPKNWSSGFPARHLSGHAVPPRRRADSGSGAARSRSATSSSAAGSICCAH